MHLWFIPTLTSWFWYWTLVIWAVSIRVLDEYYMGYSCIYLRASPSICKYFKLFKKGGNCYFSFYWFGFFKILEIQYIIWVIPKMYASYKFNLIEMQVSFSYPRLPLSLIQHWDLTSYFINALFKKLNPGDAQELTFEPSFYLEFLKCWW